MNILLLVNWRIQYGDSPNDALQPSDYCYNNKFWFFKYFTEDVKVEVVDTRSFGWIEKIEKKYLRFYIMQTLRVLPKLKKYDLIVSHGTTSGIFLAFLHRLFHLKMPPHIVVDISSFHRASTQGAVFEFCKFASKKIDYLIYHTSLQKRYLDNYFPWLKEKSSYVPFGVDAAYWNQKEYHHRTDKNSYIICVGYRMRDWNTLIQAYEKTSMKYKLVLAGNDKISSQNEQIQVLPFLPVNALMDYVANACFCVLPLEYLEYSFGQMTMLQQMAIGKVVVTADVPSVADYESEGIIRYEHENVEELSKILENLFQMDASVINAMGEANKQAIYNKYSEKNMAAAFENIIKRELIKFEEGRMYE